MHDVYSLASNVGTGKVRVYAARNQRTCSAAKTWAALTSFGAALGTKHSKLVVSSSPAHRAHQVHYF
jgi:hypothetical protein